MAYGQKLRVSGVPFFEIAAEGDKNKESLSGAQPSDAFVEIFQTCVEGK
jgi:predicted DsbA family dithiol-disulfide isomerase